MLIRIVFQSSLVLACVSVFGCSSGANAREAPDWPYDKLFQHATLVVIVKPIAVRDATAKDRAIPPRGGFDKILTGVVTSFRVLATAKGEYKHEKLEIVHFRYKANANVANGPQLIYFNTPADGTEAGIYKVKKKEYMLFFKKNKENRLEFVSGQIDSRYSVKEITSPSLIDP